MTRNTISLLTLATLALSANARAAVLFDANGFEGPTYTPGNLQGQGGFGVSDSSDNKFLVTSLFAQSGDQSLRVNAGPINYAYPVINYTPNKGEKVIVEASIARNLGTTTANTTRLYGIQVYASEGLVTEFGLMGLSTLGTIQPYVAAPINPATGEFDPNGANFTKTLGSMVSANQFVDFRAELNYEAQTLDLFADGIAIGEAIPFYKSNFAKTDLTDADIYRSSTTAGVGIDRAHFDTYRISTSTPSAVPEPASLAILGLGIVGLARRRKK